MQQQIPAGGLVQRQSVAFSARAMTDPEGDVVVLRIEHASGTTLLPLEPEIAKQAGEMLVEAANESGGSSNLTTPQSKLVVPTVAPRQ